MMSQCFNNIQGREPHLVLGLAEEDCCHYPSAVVRTPTIRSVGRTRKAAQPISGAVGVELTQWNYDTD